MVYAFIMEHCYQDLIKLFNQCFAESHNTRLEKGGDEPIYLPADASRSYHVIYFAHGFFSSALHECAHWLIAGPAEVPASAPNAHSIACPTQPFRLKADWGMRALIYLASCKKLKPSII